MDITFWEKNYRIINVILATFDYELVTGNEIEISMRCYDSDKDKYSTKPSENLSILLREVNTIPYGAKIKILFEVE